MHRRAWAHVMMRAGGAAIAVRGAPSRTFEGPAGAAAALALASF